MAISHVTNEPNMCQFKYTYSTNKNVVVKRVLVVVKHGYEMTKSGLIIGNPNFSNLFKCIVNRFKRAGYSLDIMRQTACLVFKPIMVEGHAALFSCTAVVHASDSMTASM